MYNSKLLGQTKFVKRKIIDFLFNICDEISFLIGNYGNKMELPLFNFDSKKIIRTVDFWNMEGRVYYFDITNKIKDYFLNIATLKDFIPISEENNFENLTLYKNKKLIFSICTHEGYVYIDDSIKSDMESYYKSIVKSDELFLFVKEKYLQLQNNSEFNPKEIAILNDLNNYVAKARNSMIYQTPRYEYSEGKYKFLVKKYMPQYIYPYFNNLSTFEKFEMFLCNIPDDFYNILFYYSNINIIL